MKNRLKLLIVVGLSIMVSVSCEKNDDFVDELFSPDPSPDKEESIVMQEPDLLDYTRLTGHPFLFMDVENATALRSEIQLSRAAVWNRVKDKIDRIGNPPADRTDSGEQLWQRQVGSDMSALAFAAYMTADQRYVDKAMAFALRSASYETWGRNNDGSGYDYGLAYGHQLLGMGMVYDYIRALQKEGVSIGVSEDDMNTLRSTLYNRTTRQYAAYKSLQWSLLQNHTWINAAGMLASSLALYEDFPDDARIWINFTHEKIFSQTAQMLSPDGVSQEGPGYWQYGMVFLTDAFEMMKNAFGTDYYSKSTWWTNTGDWAIRMMPPYKMWYEENNMVYNLIDFADSPLYSWYGPEHLYRRLAAQNKDGVLQFFADQVSQYNFGQEWENVLYYDPSVSVVEPTALPMSRHFNNMDYVISRNGWTGEEAVVVFKCGAPLGKQIHQFPSYLPSNGDMGHIHPDANHFIIYANGEFILKNNGYVQRLSRYHNTLLVENGQWGQQIGYYTPWPLTQSRDAYIKEVTLDDQVDCMVGVAGNSYVDIASLQKFQRKLLHLKEENMVVVYDMVATEAHKGMYLRFFPQATEENIQKESETAYLCTSPCNNVRIESLTPDQSTVLLHKETITDRSGGTTETDVFSIGKEGTEMRQVTVISWSTPEETPSKAILDRTGEQWVVRVNGKNYAL